MVAFCTVIENSDHLYFAHLYIRPESQGVGLGSKIISEIIDLSERINKPIRLGARKKSSANEFYVSHGFVKTEEGEFDNFYERKNQ